MELVGYFKTCFCVACSRYPQTWVQSTLVGFSRDYMYVRLSLHISVCPSLCLSVRLSTSIFGDNSRGPQLHAEHAALGHGVKYPEWQYNMPVRAYVCPQVFWIFCICINFQCGGSAPWWIYRHTRVQRTPVGYSRDYKSICISVSLSLYLISGIAFWQSSARTVIECNACGCRPWYQILWLVV